jgi:hypothetical protein
MYVSLKLVSAAAAWPFSESQKSVIRALFKEIRSLLLGASALAAAGIGVPFPGGRASWVNGTARRFALSAALLGLLGAGVAASQPTTGTEPRATAQGGPPWLSDFPPDHLLHARRHWPRSGFADFEEREPLSMDGVAFSLVPAAQASTRRVAQGPVAVEQQDRVLFTFRTTALSVERSAISSIRGPEQEQLRTLRAWTFQEGQHQDVWLRVDVSRLLPDHVTCRTPMWIQLRPETVDLRAGWSFWELDRRATKPAGISELSEFVFEPNESPKPSSYERFYQVDAADLHNASGEPLRFTCTDLQCKTTLQVFPDVVLRYGYDHGPCGLENFMPVTREIFKFLRARQVRP